MELELAITSYQRLSPTVTTSRRFSTEHRYRLGRSGDCDWHLPDPDRVVSSVHGEIFFRDGQFWLHDCSTNGIFVNGAVEPLGKDNETPVGDGDSLAFGDYEFRASVLGAEAPQAPLPEASTETLLRSRSAAAETTTAAVPSGIDAVAAGETGGGNPTLASGLGEQALADTHVDIPDVEIPQDWQWGPEQQPAETEANRTQGQVDDPRLATLFQALGMPELANEPVSPELLKNLGELTSFLLDQLMELLRARAQQKQKLRVQQTLFQRRENNPLKFSATPEDALDALLVRRHGAYLGPRRAIEEAFADIRAHEQALMSGVESVVGELLGAGESGSESLSRWSLLRKAQAYDALMETRAQQREEFGDTDRMLHSSTFTEAYESAASDYKEEQYR